MATPDLPRTPVPRTFTPPENPNVRIWRYVDLTKFIHLLDTQSLFFARPDKLGDRYEGSVTSRTVRNRLQHGQANNPKQPEGYNRASAHFIKQFRQAIGVSCWHMNDCESMAMWAQYVHTKQGIAIQSTYSRLREAFRNRRQLIQVGVVKYINYQTEVIPHHDLLAPFVYKQESFRHEQELRAVAELEADGKRTLDPIKGNGFYVAVDIPKLIETVYVAPQSEAWIVAVIQSVVTRYGMSFPVKQSALDIEPLF